MSKGVDQWLQCVISVPLGYDGFRCLGMTVGTGTDASDAAGASTTGSWL